MSKEKNFKVVTQSKKTGVKIGFIPVILCIMLIILVALISMKNGDVTDKILSSSAFSKSAETIEEEEEVNRYTVRSGEAEECIWKLDNLGNMVVTPNTSKVAGTKGYLFSKPDEWEALKSEIKTITFEGEIYITTGQNLFYDYSNVESIVFGEEFDTSSVTSMAQMFWRCSKLTKLDLSMFDTSNVTNFNIMFSTCIELREIDLSSFDTTRATVMSGIFNYNRNLEKVVLGENVDFKVNDGGGCFDRGTWVREEDGEEFSAVDISINSSNDSISTAGTYRKLSNTSNEIELNGVSEINPVKYKINKITKIDEINSKNNISQIVDNTSVVTQVNFSDGTTIDEEITLKFYDAVTDKDGNMYDLQMKIDNIEYIISSDGSDEVDLLAGMVEIENGRILFNSYLYNDINDVVNDYRINDGTVLKKSNDVVFNVLNKDGSKATGDLIFSAYDLDIIRDQKITSR